MHDQYTLIEQSCFIVTFQGSPRNFGVLIPSFAKLGDLGHIYIHAVLFRLVKTSNIIGYSRGMGVQPPDADNAIISVHSVQ